MKYLRARVEKRLNSKSRIFEDLTGRKNVNILFYLIETQCDHKF